jgi:mRNA interferase RelE/StbE
MNFKYKIYLSGKAKKEYEKLQKREKQRIKKKLKILESNPFPMGYKKLKGRKEVFRVRIGDYRVLYTIDTKKRAVLIFKIEKREKAY